MTSSQAVQAPALTAHEFKMFFFPFGVQLCITFVYI
jgi:hypothetical protein